MKNIFEKHKKISILAIVVLVALMLSLLFIPFGKEKKNTGEEQKTKETEKEIQQNLDDATSYYPPEDSDAFEEVDHHGDDEDDPGTGEEKEPEEAAVEVSAFTFSDPVHVENAMDATSRSFLEDASEENLLFLSSGGTLYMYSTREQRRFVIDQKVKVATITKDNAFVFYTKENNGVDVIFQYDIEMGFHAGPVIFPEDAASIEHMVYYGGALMFSYTSLSNEGEIHSQIEVVPTHLSDFPREYRHTTFQESSSVFTVDSAGMFFGYNPVKHAIEYYPMGGNAQVTEYVPDDIPKDSLLHFSLSKESGMNYLMVYINYDKGIQPLVINGKAIESFPLVSKAEWISDDTVLVNTDADLYLYHIKEKEPTLLKRDINTFSVYNNTIFYQTVDKQIFQIKYTKKEG